MGGCPSGAKGATWWVETRVQVVGCFGSFGSLFLPWCRSQGRAGQAGKQGSTSSISAEAEAEEGTPSGVFLFSGEPYYCQM